MKNKIRMLSLALAAAMLFASFGCLVEKDGNSASPSVAPVETGAAGTASVDDRNAVAVTLGDLTFTAGEVEDMYNSYIDLFSYYGMSAPTDEQTIAEYVQMAVEALISSKVPIWKAAEKGIVLTEEELAKIDSDAHYSADEEYTNLVLSYANYYTDAGSVENISDLTDEQLQETLNYLNLDIQDYYGDTISDIDVYIADAFDHYTEEALINAYSDKLRAESDASVTLDDAAVDTWYENAYADQKEELNTDPTAYRDYRESEDALPILYVPEGLAVIKVVTCQPEGEAPAEIAENEAKLLELEAEYGKLALTGADEATLNEIRETYEALVAETDALKQDYFGKAEAEIQALQEKLQAGESFDAIAPDAKEQVLYLNDTDPEFPDEVREAVLALKEGEVSPAITVGDTIYLIYYVGPLTSGATDRTLIADAIRAAAEVDAKDAAWEELLTAWDEEAFQKAVYHAETYAYIGR